MKSLVFITMLISFLNITQAKAKAKAFDICLLSNSEKDMALRHMGKGEFEQLYFEGRSVIPPLGLGRGRVIKKYLNLDSFFDLFWKGKFFNKLEDGTIELVNYIPLAPGGKAFKADVYVGESLFDPGTDAVALDYSKKSPYPLNQIRDEIREICPEYYLGHAYLFGKKVVSFTLAF